MNLAKIYSSSKAAVRTFYHVTQDDIDKDINILKEWLKKQPHLPMDLLTDDLLESLLLKNKFSIEKTKSKIENYCTLRSRHMYLYENFTEIVPSKGADLVAPMFELTDQLERIIVCRIFDESNFSFERSVRCILLQREMYLRKDYSCGDIFLVDMAGTSPAIMSKLSPTLFGIALNLSINAYSTRIKAIHIINCGRFVNMLLNMMKPFVPSKVLGRIVIHDNVNALLETFPKRCLPKDYGGDLKYLKDIAADLDIIYEESEKLFLTALKTVSDESLRPAHSKNCGVEGTFRKLQID